MIKPSNNHFVCSPLDARISVGCNKVYMYPWICKESENSSFTSPFSDYDFRVKSEQYVNHVSAIYSPLLIEYVNRFHRTNYNENYWKLLIGFWFNYFVRSLYEKYIIITQALNEHHDLTFTGLSPSSYIVPVDLHDFILSSYHHFYHLQLCSRVIEFLNLDVYQKVDINSDYYPKPVDCEPFNPLTSIKRCIKRRLNLSSPVLIYNGYFSDAKIERSIMFNSRFNISLMYSDRYVTERIDADIKNRLDIEIDKPTTDNEFEKILLKCVPYELPTCYLEGRSNLMAVARKRFGPKQRTYIFSASSWYLEEEFKIWAAEQQLNGAKLIGIQHGGTYGIYNFNNEIPMLDKFYSWGWETDKKPNVYPFYSTKLKSHPPDSDNEPSGILFAGTYITRSPYIDYHHAYSFEQYFNDAETFIASLSEELFKLLKYRLYQNVASAAIKQRFVDRFNDLSLQDWSIPILDAISQAKVFVVDYLSTTYIESLSLNKPTVLFWPVIRYDLTDIAIPLIKKLKEAKILHDTPESAAAFVNEHYDHIDDWWGSDPVQNISDEFRNTFGRTSSNAQVWTEELSQYY